MVTGDALYTQRELSRSILEQGGDYFWVVKDNQPGVRESVSLLFEQPPWGRALVRRARRVDMETGGNSGVCGHQGLLVFDVHQISPFMVSLSNHERRIPGSRVGIGSLEPEPGLAWVGTGLLRGTDPLAQGQGDRGTGLRHHQPSAG